MSKPEMKVPDSGSYDAITTSNQPITDYNNSAGDYGQ